MWVYIACLRANANAFNALRPQIWITQCYLQTTSYLPLLPVTEHHRPLAGTHCACPRRDDQAEFTWITHPNTNLARHRVTSLI